MIRRIFLTLALLVSPFVLFMVTSAEDEYVAIFIDVTPLSPDNNADFNVKITLSPRSNADLTSVQISLPWYVKVGAIQCVGDCGSGSGSTVPTVVSTTFATHIQSSTYLTFPVTVIDDTYAAFGIVVTAGDSRQDVFVPITRTSTRDTMGDVQVIALTSSGEPNSFYMIDFRVNMPLSGGILMIIPPGFQILEGSGCVDPVTRKITDSNQMCVMTPESQQNGDVWFRGPLSTGEFDLRLILHPSSDSVVGTVDLSIGGRYFESEHVLINIPDSFMPNLDD